MCHTRSAASSSYAYLPVQEVQCGPPVLLAWRTHGEGREVGGLVPLVVAVHGADVGGPGLADAQHALGLACRGGRGRRAEWVGKGGRLGQGLPAAGSMHRLPSGGCASFMFGTAVHAAADHSHHTPCKGSHLCGSSTHPPARCSCRPPARASRRRRAGRLHRKGQGEGLAAGQQSQQRVQPLPAQNTKSQASHAARSAR